VSEPEGGERGFVVVDKRGGDEAPAAEGGAKSATERELPKPDFPSLLISLGHSALYHLGLVADPQTGQRGERNLALARETIDLVEMLQQKTRGNLTPDEERLLEDLLYDLRMRYVEAAR
jgi:hypothetical protein